MEFRINGTSYHATPEARVSLLDVLRDGLGLSGTKKGCNQGGCGACTVLADGERILSCLALAVQYQDRAITTIEGVGTVDRLHPLQRAFIACDGFQCGYCTPGQICSAIGMVDEVRRGVPSRHSLDRVTPDVPPDVAAGTPLDDDEIRERMSGNLCRCGAYNGIVAAIRDTFTEEAAS